MSYAKSRPFCLSLIVLNGTDNIDKDEDKIN